MFMILVMCDKGTKQFGVIAKDRDRDIGTEIENISRQIGNPKLFETYNEAKKSVDDWASKKYLNHLTFIVENY